MSDMGIFDRVRESTTADRDDGSTRDTEPAADAGNGPDESVERSEAGSSLANAEAATGGADAVPDTPDAVAENYN
jgi:hypothetical protein